MLDIILLKNQINVINVQEEHFQKLVQGYVLYVQVGHIHLQEVPLAQNVEPDDILLVDLQVVHIVRLGHIQMKEPHHVLNALKVKLLEKVIHIVINYINNK